MMKSMSCLLLYLMLDRVFFSADKDDKRLWSLDPKGQFSVRSFYDVLIREQAIVSGWKFYCNKLVLPEVAVFCCVARFEKILTVDNLKKRCHILMNGCLLFLVEEESPNHLLIHCNFSTRIWAEILNIFWLR